MKKSMSQGTRWIITILNLFLILLCTAAMVCLAIGNKNAGRTGTFNLFGRSYHLNRSSAMEPVIGKNDLIVVWHMPPTNFVQGDLIAFYETQGDSEYLIIRRLDEVDGTDYLLSAENGEEMVLSATDTRFLGVVKHSSGTLGKAVLFLQSDDGKVIFLWWSAAIFLLTTGVSILLHVILKNRKGNGSISSGDDRDEVQFRIEDHK